MGLMDELQNSGLGSLLGGNSNTPNPTEREFESNAGRCNADAAEPSGRA